MRACAVAAPSFWDGEELERRWLGVGVVHEGHSGHPNGIVRGKNLTVRVWEGVRSETIAGRVGAVRNGLVLVILQWLVVMWREGCCGAIVVILLLCTHQGSCMWC